MPIVKSDIFINQPRSKIFELAQDYNLRLDWDPFLAKMKFLDGAIEASPNVKVWVQAKNGLKMTVKYITLEFPKFVAMDMVKGPFFFKRFAGTWKFEESDKGTRVIFKYNFELISILKPFLTKIIIAKFGKDIKARLSGLKYSAEETDILTKLPKK